MIIQNEPESEGAAADMSFTVPRADLPTARDALDPVVSDVGIFRVAEDPTMGKVSVVGAGMKSHPGVAAKVFATLGNEDINIEMISTSPIKISCVVAGRARARRPCARCTRPSSSAPTTSAPSTPSSHEPARRRRGRHRRGGHRDARASCASATSRSSEIVPFASERSAGRELDGRARSCRR